MTSANRSTSRWSRTPGRAALAAAVLAFALGGCSGSTATTAASAAGQSLAPGPTLGATPAATLAATEEVTPVPTTGPFTLESDAFAEGGAIPREYTCQGTNLSPVLTWTGAPAGTAQLVLVVDDPDAGGFVHWIALIGGGEAGLPRGVPPSATAPQQGINGFGNVGWGGPCPPSGTHHYRFTLTALAAPTGLVGHPSISQVRAAIAKATALGATVLTGTYRKT